MPRYITYEINTAVKAYVSLSFQMYFKLRINTSSITNYIIRNKRNLDRNMLTIVKIYTIS